jgi:putative restriction endonuclease
MSTARSFADITQNIEFVSLNSDLHMLFCQPYSRAALREELVVKWFGTTRAPMDDLLAEELGSDHYEASLFELMQGNRSAVVAPPPAVRSAAFRRVVGEVYDYRCAASGWRIILPDSRAIVEAAHLIPFAEGHDDDPRNGIALAPSYHWALDNHIIAPGPDLKWHVSEALDDRIADNRPLISLKGRSLILPKDESSWPRSDALEWRLSRLLVS